MPDPIDPAKAVEYETALREILKARQGDAPDGEAAKEHLQAFRLLFETPGGSTLMTVLLGGVFAAVINGCIQDGITVRQAEQNRATAAHAAQLEVLKDKIKDRGASTRDMVELVGRVVTDTQNLAQTYGPDFQPPRGKADADVERARLLSSQVLDVRKTFNETQSLWSKRRDLIGYTLLLYYEGDKDVAASWQKVAAAVDQFVDWAARLHEHPKDYRDAAVYEKKVRDELGVLAAALARASEPRAQASLR
jgi:hypothetical protein